MGNLLLDIYIYFFAAKSICNFLYISYIYSLIFSILPPIFSIFIKSKSKFCFLEDFLNFTLPTFICLYAHSHTHTNFLLYYFNFQKLCFVLYYYYSITFTSLYSHRKRTEHCIFSYLWCYSYFQVFFCSLHWFWDPFDHFCHFLF